MYKFPSENVVVLRLQLGQSHTEPVSFAVPFSAELLLTQTLNEKSMSFKANLHSLYYSSNKNSSPLHCSKPHMAFIV